MAHKDSPEVYGPELVEVTCPECGYVQQVVCWRVIPSFLWPEAVEGLVNGTLFEYECEKCGYFDLLQYRCLYHDVPNRAIVLFEPVTGGDELGALSILDGMRSKDRERPLAERSVTTYRFVRHADVLCEKARILLEGLDDRAVELTKAAHHKLLATADELYAMSGMYYRGLTDDDALVFSVSGVEDGTIVIDYDSYVLAKELVDSQVELADAMPAESEIAALMDDYAVGRRWAEAFLGLLGG